MMGQNTFTSTVNTLSLVEIANNTSKIAAKSGDVAFATKKAQEAFQALSNEKVINAELEQENEQLRRANEKALSLLEEITLRSNKFALAINHIRTAWGDETQVSTLLKQAANEVDNDAAIKEKIRKNVHDIVPTPPRKRKQMK